MKKVWVLERFIDPQECKKSLDDLYKMREANADDAERVKTCDEVISCYEKRMTANPDGYWLGYEGKIVYRDFCYCAKRTMRNLAGSTFRVVEAEIASDAKTWLGYKVVKENAGVLRYLYATM